jgi:hypothetical protein
MPALAAQELGSKHFAPAHYHLDISDQVSCVPLKSPATQGVRRIRQKGAYRPDGILMAFNAYPNALQTTVRMVGPLFLHEHMWQGYFLLIPVMR